MVERGADHWPEHARAWALVGPPLRPCAADVARFEAAIARSGFAGPRSSAGGRSGDPITQASRVLVLGVTPELVAMRLPEGSSMLAIERSGSVIAALFRPAPHARAVAADWLAMPSGDATFDVAIGDGSLSNLPFPAGYRAIAAELARVLVPGGCLALRLFATPEAGDAETLADVERDLAAGRVDSFHALKWRVAMAIQPATRRIAVADIRRGIDAIVPDRAALAARTGWPRTMIEGIDVYRDSSAVYSFPTAREATAALTSAGDLAVERIEVSTYPLGERCPIVALRRR